MKELRSRFWTILTSFVAGVDFISIFDAISENNAVMSAFYSVMTIILLIIAIEESKED